MTSKMSFLCLYNLDKNIIPPDSLGAGGNDDD